MVCPICGTTMKRIDEGYAPTVTSYSCSTCDFYWLADGGISFEESGDLYRNWLQEMRSASAAHDNGDK